MVNSSKQELIQFNLRASCKPAAKSDAWAKRQKTAVEENYSWQRVLDDMESVYHEVTQS
jgi:glycogen synthase